jgi:hypothetical protein
LCYNCLQQRFSNLFQVGTTFISQNVLRTALLLSPLKANCSRFSTTVCDTQFTLILFFLSFFWTKRATRAEPEDHLRSADHILRNAGQQYSVQSHAIQVCSVGATGYAIYPRCAVRHTIQVCARILYDVRTTTKSPNDAYLLTYSHR